MAETAKTTDPAPTDEAEELRAAQLAEYGTWVATEPIDVGAVRAFNVGDPVPVSHVKAYGYDKQGLVKKRGS